MSKKAHKPTTERLSDQALESVTGGGPSQSQCESDDGKGTGGKGSGGKGSGGRRGRINDLTSYVDPSN